MPGYRDAADKRTRYEALRSSLWTERASGFDAHWQELSNFLQPKRTRFWAGDRNRGDKRNQFIIDSTARFAVRTLQAGLHAGLTSPARPWFKLGTPDPNIAEHYPVKDWLYTVTRRMLTIFEQSNLYNVLPIVYGDMGVFGTAAMALLPDKQDLFRCYSYPIGSYALGQDARGLTTTFVRDYVRTVRQVVEEFGVSDDGRTIDWTPISSHVKALWDRGDYESPVELTWLVKPNDDERKDRLEAKYKPWTSCYWEKGSSGGDDGRKFLRESGFDTFPIMAPRWDITGEDTYGTDSPGMTALGDVKQLQSMTKEKGKAIAKMVNPPVAGPASLRGQKVSLLPGDITFVDAREGMQGLKPIHEVNINLADLRDDISQVQYRIQRAFYEDLFLMMARSDEQRGSQPITAREVDERREEKLLALGPVLERTSDELLSRMVDRTFAMMLAAGLIPPAPPEIQGMKLKIEYLSIMAQAQKLIGANSLDRFMTGFIPLTQIDPAVVFKLNTNAVAEEYADIHGVSPRILRTDAEAQKLAGAQAQAHADAAQADQALKTAQAMKAAGDTSMTDDSALTRLTRGLGQQMAEGGGPAGPGMPNAPLTPGR